MLKRIENRSEEGFTLIELMIVIVIIGILAAITLPIFSNQQKAAIDAQTKSDVKNARLAMTTYLAKHGGKLPSDAVTANVSSIGERNIYSTEGALDVSFNNDISQTIVNPNGIELTLSSGTRLRIYDRVGAGEPGMETGIYYVKAWNPDGAQYVDHNSRIVFNGYQNQMLCVVNTQIIKC